MEVKCRMKKQKQAFSLIELSLVITVIALLTTIVIATKKTLHNAKIISFINQIETNKLSYELFIDKFGAPPGDITNASSLFTDAVDAGDGNGFIDYASSSTAEPAIGAAESNAAWQHLKLSGLITGNFSGALGGSVGVTYPECKLLQDCSLHFSSVNIHAQMAREQNYLITAQNSTTSFETISAKDAYNIDYKIDDGLPYNGWVNGVSTASNCSEDLDLTWSSNLENASYLASSSTSCIMIFTLDLDNFSWQ